MLDSRQRFPTLLRLLVYQVSNMIKTLSELCRFYGWTDVAVICDRDKKMPNNFYPLMCQALSNGLTTAINGTLYMFNHEYIKVGNHKRILRDASHVSRGKQVAVLPEFFVLICSESYCLDTVFAIPFKAGQSSPAG